MHKPHTPSHHPHSPPEVTAYYRTRRWAELRGEALSRDPHCVLCGRRPEIVHHRRWPEVLGVESAEDLTPLCRACALRHYLRNGYCWDCIGAILSQADPSPVADTEMTARADGRLTGSLHAFEYLCELYARKQALPDGVSGADFEESTEEILDAVKDDPRPMSDAACDWLGLPVGTSYAEGADTLMGGPNFTEEELQRLNGGRNSV